MGEGENEIAQPYHRLAEIIGMARERPQAGLDQLAAIGRIAAEPFHLHVAPGLEDEADQPRHRRDRADDPALRHRRGEGKGETGAPEPQHSALQQVDLIDAPPDPTPSHARAPSGVGFLFLAAVAAENLYSKARPP